ncbi:hypothetical protein ACFLYH_02835 [Candidatus Dependentiae bacterium]
MLKENSFHGFCLTPTILRSTEASILALGLVRSLAW